MMFDQTFVDGVGKTNKSWTVMVSTMVQAGIVGVLVILPLIFTDVLPKASLASLISAAILVPPRGMIAVSSSARDVSTAP